MGKTAGCPGSYSCPAVVAAEVNVKKVERADIPVGTVKLETRLTPILVEEGRMRDLIREIQQLRKEAGCRRDEVIDLKTPYWPKSIRLANQVKSVALVGTVASAKKLAIEK